jgi:hypothetical protein
MEEKSIYQALQDFGNKVQRDLRKSLVDKKANASKNLSQSIAFNVKFKSETEIQFKLELDEYYKWVDKGRGKATKQGTIPLRESIYQWIIQKGLPVGKLTEKGAGKKMGVSKPRLRSMIETQRRSMAYFIARKINRFGTKGNNFYSNVVNEDLLNGLREDLSAAFTKDVLIEIKLI